MANSATISGLEFLLDAKQGDTGPLCAVSGSEAFLKHEVIATLRQRLVGDGDAELAWNVFQGPDAEWPDVADVVASRSLFGGGESVALIEAADKFVTRCRDALENHAASGASGVVLLEVRSMPGNTRLGKAIAEHGLHVKCTAPDRGAELAKFQRDAARWLAKRAKEQHSTSIDPTAIEVLMDLLPLSLGVLDQEIARLSLLAEGRSIDAALVRDNVGGWRARTAWEMIDAALEGRPDAALNQLDRLLLSGEQPIGVLAQLGSTLRKFSSAVLVIERDEARGKKADLSKALGEAGVARFKLADSVRQLRSLGRHRGRQLDRWLLDADLAMKGHNSSPARARIELERLLVRISAKTAEAAQR